MKINVSSPVLGLVALSMAFSLSTPCTAGKWVESLVNEADWDTLNQVMIQGMRKANETSDTAKKKLWFERMKNLYAAKPETGTKLAQEKYTELLMKALELKDQKTQSVVTQKNHTNSNANLKPFETKAEPTPKTSPIILMPKSEDLETWEGLNKTAPGRIRLRQEALLLIENGPSLGTKPSQKYGGLLGGFESALGGEAIAIQNLKKVIHLDPLPEEITWTQYGCVRGWVKKYNVALLEKLTTTLNGPIHEKYTKK